MLTDVAHLTVLVEDADEALAWYTDAFGFEPREDEEFVPGMRWVTVAPPDGDVELVLREPSAEFFGEERAAELRSRISNPAA